MTIELPLTEPHGPEVPLAHLDELWFQVTGTLCNLTCRHCFISCSPHNHAFGLLDLATVRRFLDESVPLGVKEYYFTGGEPFLHRDMTSILEMTLDYGPATVLTNGTVLQEDWLSRLRRADGDYRWAAEVMNHVVFAAPDNDEARELQADILEQIGYQSESGPWRDMFLSGALELRGGPAQEIAVSTTGPDVMAAISLDMLLDFLGVKFNPAKAGDVQFTISLELTDTGEVYALEARNGVLNTRAGRKLVAPDAAILVTKPALFKLLGRQADMAGLMKEGLLSIVGEAAVLARLFGALDEFSPNFNLASGRLTHREKQPV